MLNVKPHYSKEQIEQIVDDLRDLRPSVYDAPIETLGQMGNSAIPVLIAALADSVTYFRGNVHKALLRLGEPALQHLYKAYDAGATLHKISIVEAIAEFGEPALAMLINISQRNDESWWHAVTGLGKIGDVAFNQIVFVLENGSIEQRRWAASALSGFQYAKAGQALIKALEDKDEQVNYFAVNALGQIGAEEALPVLRKQLKQKKGRIILGRKFEAVVAQAIDRIIEDY